MKLCHIKRDHPTNFYISGGNFVHFASSRLQHIYYRILQLLIVIDWLLVTNLETLEQATSRRLSNVLQVKLMLISVHIFASDLLTVLVVIVTNCLLSTLLIMCNIIF